MKLTSSLVSFAAGQSDALAKSEVTGIENYLNLDASFRAKAVMFATGTDLSDLTVTEVILRSKLDPEKQERLYSGAAVPLADVMPAFGRTATKVGMLSKTGYNIDHGVELHFTYSSVGALTNAVLIWDF
jgi:hypothetical protein